MFEKSDQLAFSDCSRLPGFKSSQNNCSIEDYHISKEMSYRAATLSGSAAMARSKLIFPSWKRNRQKEKNGMKN
jgi:hypothetical protein